MESYDAIRLKCCLRRITAGMAIILITIGILIPIIKEIVTAYDAGSRIAYAAGILTCLILLIPGFILLYQAFHFEKAIFGKDSGGLQALQEDLTREGILSTDSLILTDRYLLMLARNLTRMVSAVPVQSLIACFETHGSNKQDKTADYSLLFYDTDFHAYTVVIKAKQAEDGQEIRSRLCTQMPWIFHTEEEQKSFDMWRITPAGKRSILSRLERRKHKENA